MYITINTLKFSVTLPAYLAFDFNRKCLLLDAAQIASATLFLLPVEKILCTSSYSRSDDDMANVGVLQFL